MKFIGPTLLGLILFSGSLPAQMLASLSHGTPSPFASLPPASASDAAVRAELPIPAIVLGMPPGATLLEATFPAMSGAVCTASAEMAESSSYAFSRAQLAPAAWKAAFVHDNLVKMAQNFVPGKQLPDAPYYHPLSVREKFDLFLRSSHSLSTSVGILSDSLVSQATGAYPRFAPGLGGYGQRLGVSAAGAEGAAFIGGFVFPTLMHQDPRYFRSHQNGVANRLAYAASRVLIGRSDHGRSVINASVISSQFVEAAVSNAYVPYRNETVSGTMENALTGLAGVAEGNIIDEFWPDIREFVVRHTTSKLIRRSIDATMSTPYNGNK